MARGIFKNSGIWRWWIPAKEVRHKLKPAIFGYRGHYGSSPLAAKRRWENSQMPPIPPTWEGFISRIKYTPGVNWFMFNSGEFHDAT